MKIKKSIMLRMRCGYGMLLFIFGVLLTSAFITFDSTEWGPWTVVSEMHSGIEVRIKKGPYNAGAKKSLWEVQFRNNYHEAVVFCYGFTRAVDRDECVLDHRRHLQSGKVSQITEALLDDRYEWKVCIDRVEKKM